MNNELIERMNKVSSRSLDGDVVMDMAEWNAIVDLVDQIMLEHSGEVALLRSKIDTLHRLMVTAEKRGASKEAEPVAQHKYYNDKGEDILAKGIKVSEESETLAWRIRQVLGEFNDEELSVVELAYALSCRLKAALSKEAEPVASSQPTELEMHRADYNAIQAAGFDSPGELLAAYNTLQAYTGRDLNQFIEDEADRPAWFMGGAENVVCVSDLRQWMAGHAMVPVEPTEKMILAAIVAADRRLPFISDTQKVIAIWNAMLTASKEGGK